MASTISPRAPLLSGTHASVDGGGAGFLELHLTEAKTPFTYLPIASEGR